MIKSCCFLSFVLCLICSCLFAQDNNKLSIQYGEIIKSPYNEAGIYLLGADSSSIFTISLSYHNNSISSSRSRIDKYNKEMDRTMSRELSLINPNKKDKLMDVLWFQNELFLLFRTIKNKKAVMSLYKVNKKKLSVPAEPFYRSTFELRRSFEGDDMRMEASEKDNAFVVHTSFKGHESEPVQMKVWAFNNDSLMYDRKFDMKHIRLRYEMKEVVVSETATVGILGKVHFSNASIDKLNGKPNYLYSLLHFSNDSSTLKELSFKAEENFITDITFEYTEKGKAVAAGLYSIENERNANGAFKLDLDLTKNQIVSKNYSEFADRFVWLHSEPLHSKRLKRKAKKGKNIELEYFKLKKLIPRNDGGLLMLAEQDFVSDHDTKYFEFRIRWPIEKDLQYFKNNIAIINLGPDGEIDWAKKIPKRQMTFNDYGINGSFFALPLRSKIYFVYNDNPRNLFRKEDEKLFNMNVDKDMTSMLTTVNAGGQIESTKLFVAEEVKSFIRPKWGKAVRANEVFFIGERYGNTRLIKMQFPD